MRFLFNVSVIFAIVFLVATVAPTSAYAVTTPCTQNACAPQCDQAYINKPGLVCIAGPKPWCFEEILGVSNIKGIKFNPGNGLEFLGWLFFALLALTAVTALMWVVWAAIQYIYSAGSTTGKGAAKQKIWNSLYGLVLALAAILLLYTINPELTSLRLPAMPFAEKVSPDLAGCLEGKGYLMAWSNKDCGTVCPNGTKDTIDTGKMWCLCK